MKDRLTGKVIVVAGAGGIGDELARRYAGEGASVVLGDINGDGARAVAEEICRAGGAAIGTDLDGSDEDSIRAAVEQAVTAFGGLDGFHANFAGFVETDATCDILGLPMRDFDDVMRVNSRGFVLCTRHALPAMLERGGGTMVYTSTDAAYLGEPVRLAYAMSKASLHALMRHVARRFGRQGIRANVIAPGTITHARLEALLPPELIAEFREGTVVGHLGTPADIAAMGALLMSEEGRYITGQIISVNGGAVMRP